MKKHFLSQSFRVLLTPLAYIHVGEAAKNAKKTFAVFASWRELLLKLDSFANILVTQGF